MARITICDLCKNRIRDDESKQGELTLSFYTEINMVPCDNTDCGATPGVYCKPCADQDIPKHEELVAELCHSCTTLIRKTITGDDPLVTSKKPQKKPERFGAPAVERSDIPPTGEPLGPSAEEKAERAPTQELLDDEVMAVPSRFNKRRAVKMIAAQKGECGHHFKGFHEGKIICGNAPKGIKGDLKGFVGCGKALAGSEY